MIEGLETEVVCESKQLLLCGIRVPCGSYGINLSHYLVSYSFVNLFVTVLPYTIIFYQVFALKLLKMYIMYL